MRNERGTILVSGLGFIGIFLTTVFALMFALGLIQEKRNSLNFCRQVTSQNLKVIKSNFKQLKLLNPLALSLRTQWTEVNLAIIAAQALLPESLPLLQKLIIRRNLIHSQRQKLDQTQKFFLKKVSVQNQAYRMAMISGTNAKTAPKLTSPKASVFGDLEYTSSNNITSQSLLSYRQVYSNFHLVSSAAMVPDIPDLAPMYEPANDFISLTTLAAHWQSGQLTDGNWINGKTELSIWDDGCAFYLTKSHFAIRAKSTNGGKPLSRQ